MTDVLNYDDESPVEGTRTIAELGARAAKPQRVERGEIYLVNDGHGGKELIETPDVPEFAEAAVNHRTVTNDAAFIAYVNRHGCDQTEIWADQKHNRIVGVVDAHASNEASASERFGHEQHYVTLSLEHTPAWSAWVNGQGLSGQAKFAEHIEEYAENVFSPPSAELLEIAQTLQGSRKAEFTSGTRLSNGEFQFAYVEDLQGKAGKNGQLTIPEEFELGLAPYLGGAAYKVVAKLRWRLDGGNVQIGYKLIGIDRILEEAFKEIVTAVTAGVTYPVFDGRP